MTFSDFEAMRAEQSLYDRLGGHAGILKLIKPFYADVRQHNVLGPIFNSHTTDWPAHMILPAQPEKLMNRSVWNNSNGILPVNDCRPGRNGVPDGWRGKICG